MISSWWALFSGFWAWSLELIGLLLFFLFFFSVLRLFFLSDLLSLLILFWNMGRDNFLVYFETMFGHWENEGKKKKPRERKPLLVYIIQHLTSDPLSRTSYKIPELSFLFLSFLSKQSQHECINSIKICFAGLMIWSCSILSWNFLIFSKFFPRECFL